MHLDVKEGSTLIQKELRTLDEHSRIKMTCLTLLVSDVPATAVRQRSHPTQLRSTQVQEVSLNEINIGDLLQSNNVIQWLSQ